MRKIPESTFEKWKYAFKMDSWPKVFVPYLFSISLVYHSSGSFSISSAIISCLYILFLVWYIVFLNDYSDSAVDLIKRAMFPNDCSPKTIPDGILSENQVLTGGLFSLTALLLLGFVSYYFFLASSITGIIYSILTFWLYSLKPFRLNYRGGGELAEAMGIAILIPFTIFQLFGETLKHSDYIWILPFFLLSISSAIASGLADEASDKIGGKKTIVTIFGSTKAKISIVVFYGIGIGMYAGITMIDNSIPLKLISVCFIVFGIISIIKLFSLTMNVSTNSFVAITAFKKYLHFFNWTFLIVVSILLLLV